MGGGCGGWGGGFGVRVGLGWVFELVILGFGLDWIGVGALGFEFVVMGLGFVAG